MILKDKKILFKKFKKKYNILLKSKIFKSKLLNRTVVNKGPVCHSKSKETYINKQNQTILNFHSKNLAKGFKFLIEGDKFFFKNGCNQFKLSMTI